MLRGYLVVGSILIIGIVFLYTNNLIQRLNAQADFFSTLLARFLATATIPATESPEIARAVEETTKHLDFPVIVTDAMGRPIAWTRVGTGVSPDEVGQAEAMRVDPQNPPEGPLKRLILLTRELDRRHRPIPVEQPGTKELIGLVHYGESSVIQDLRWYGIAEIIAMFLFGVIAYWGFLNVKRAEQRSIWVGMARETAHQLGTPLSSLMGWVEVLRDRLAAADGAERAGPGGAPAPASVATVSLPGTEVEEVLVEMERDLERVSKIANRFGHIGSIPRLAPEDVVPVVRETVEYMKRRLPRLGVQVTLRETYADVPQVALNRELFEWAMENLLRNAADAIEGEGQSIEVGVALREGADEVDVSIRDTGRGMTLAEQHRAFAPGYTTKSAGWGLGLTLVKRIVEEYHGGRVAIRQSAPGQGSTFVMSFPV